MAAFLADLTLITDFIFKLIVDIWNVIMDSPLLLSAFGLWVLRKVFNVFDLIKG